jgi:predicted site-specific integrase-resolvase
MTGFTMKRYTIGEFGKKVNKSPITLRRWDREGRLVAKRTLSGHRYYEESDIFHALGLDVPDKEKKVVVYCRVSSRGQKTDMKSQVESMRLFCLGSGESVDDWIEDYGSGLNFRRPKFLSLMEQISNGQIKKVLIAHKDRLVRFGFDYFTWFAEQNGCKIIVVNQEFLSPQQEMVEDLMSIIHCFSSRLYGLRSYKNKIKEVIEEHQSDE